MLSECLKGWCSETVEFKCKVPIDGPSPNHTPGLRCYISYDLTAACQDKDDVPNRLVYGYCRGCYRTFLETHPRAKEWAWIYLQNEITKHDFWYILEEQPLQPPFVSPTSRELGIWGYPGAKSANGRLREGGAVITWQRAIEEFPGSHVHTAASPVMSFRWTAIDPASSPQRRSPVLGESVESIPAPTIRHVSPGLPTASPEPPAKSTPDTGKTTPLPAAPPELPSHSTPGTGKTTPLPTTPLEPPLRSTPSTGKTTSREDPTAAGRRRLEEKRQRRKKNVDRESKRPVAGPSRTTGQE